ncbi:MAG: MG2 domain-containing protein [Flavobacteriaceae bacterium]|nr:MG2 domain-containing protein [Flavobacteriaceae bacterium]
MNFSKALCILLLGVFVFSCKPKNPQESTNNLFKFKEYITQTTSGEVSVASSIRIDLLKEVDSWVPNQEITENILSVSPSVKGTLIALNSRTVLFKPSENLKENKEYQVTINLGKLYANVLSEYKKYTFKFKTLEQNFSISTNTIQSYSKKRQYIEGVLRASDVMSLKDVEQILSATHKGEKLKIKWTSTKGLSRFYEFRIDSIKRYEDDTEVAIKWKGSKVGVDNNGESTFKIIGVNNFSIVKMEVVQSPEQSLQINFSDPLKKQQNFSGLVAIQNAKKLKYIVDGNILKVYPTNKIVGNVTIDVFQGIKSVDGYKLKKPLSEKITFEQIKPQVRLISNGVILPNSSNLKFNFEAINLSAVDIKVIKIYEDNVLQFLQENNLNYANSYNIRRVGRRIVNKTMKLTKEGLPNNGKWKTYAIDLSKMIKADTGAIYRIELSFKKAYSLYSCDGIEVVTNTEDDYYEEDYYYDDTEEYTTAEATELNEREEQYWDNLIYNYHNRRYYSWKDRENPCKEAYFDNDNRIVSANILASNLGIIVKKGENKSYFFAVTDILTTQPISGANVKIYNYQQQEIASLFTDSQGFSGFDANKNAYFAIVSKGKSKTYIKLNDGHSLSMSKFDVSGQQLQKGLKGFIYGERGVWRPGDSIHLTFVLNDKTNPLPKKHPIKMELTDAQGKLVYKKIKTDNINGFTRFSISTSDASPTGNWQANVSVGGAHFSKNIKVETIKPNRLKIKLDFPDKVLSSKNAINGAIAVNWLHGAPGKNLRTEIKAKFTSISIGFKGFDGYVFRDPIRKFNSEELVIFDKKVDADGKATINKKLNLQNKAPGMLRATFFTRAFENGGDFSMDVFSKNYAPYISFVGLKSPKSRAYGSFFTDEDVTFDVATVDDKGNSIKRNGLEVKIYKISWRWWWSSSYDDLSSYVGSQHHKPFKSLKINTNSKGKASFNINVPNDKGGRYLIRIYDPKSGHATGRTTYFYKDWWKRPNSDPESAKMLIFSSDKDTYNVGETAKITFPSGAEGRALISIENGTEVIHKKWKKTKKGETTIDIPITAEMAPNVFVNISLLQPHASTVNDLPIRMYGIIPLMVENPKTRLNPQISMPKTLRPEEKFTIKVSEKNGKRMTYTLAVVDEGLLGLTRYKAPNVWNEFYKKEALGVKTWDIFDDVIGAYGGSIEQVFAIGGDANATGAKNKKANRFKPVVTYLGPFILEKGKTKSHTITMPKYIGAVRTMVIAGDNSFEAYGTVEKSTPVKKPLMVLASLPRKLSPGEKITLPVTVFAMEDKVKNATISLKLDDKINIIGAKTKSVSFAQPDEKMVYFELDVSDAKGISKIEVIAIGNGEKSSYEVEIDVTNPNPISNKVSNVVIDGKGSEIIDFSTFGVNGTNSATVEFSTLPSMDFTGRLQYLIRYPHGCVEQTTSSVFPQLFLADIFDLTLNKKQEMNENIRKGIEKLGHFQVSNGGLSYWRGQNAANDWGTSYAGHFMIEAEKKGFVLPLTFISNWLRYQQKTARDWRPRYNQYNADVAQAYRLYTLALSGHPDLASMNRLREFRELSNTAKWRLAAAYALAGQKEAAKKVANTANIHFTSNRYDYYSYGSVDRNKAMALETMLLVDDTQIRILTEDIAKNLSSDRWMSTQSTAYSLLAMSKMVDKNGGKALKLSYSINGKQLKSNTEKAVSQRDLDIRNGNNQLKITNLQENTVYVRVVNSGKLPLGQEITEKRNLGISIVYRDSKGKKMDVSKLTQGTDFTASITIRNLKHEYVNDIALTEIFPSGWEIVNTRFTDFGSSKRQSNFTDIRDDRVNFYFDLGSQKSKTFEVKLNASYLGRYYLYGVQAEAMYDNDYFTRTKGRWIEVVK